jgi:hypothetical protein
MSLNEYIRSLVAPDQDHWKTMLMGLALFAACAGAAVFLRPSGIVSVVLVLLGIASWFVGACAMVGYVRWYFASEVARAKRERDAD